MIGGLLVGFVCLILLFSVSWFVDFQWVRVAQTLVFCVMVGGLLVGFVCLNPQFSVSWQVDLQWGSCGSIFSFLCHDWQTFRGFRVAQSLDICFMLGRILVGFVCLNLQVSVSWLVNFQWVRVAQYLDFCVMIGGILVGFVWLNLLFSVSWLVDFQWASCVSFYCFLFHGWQTFSGFVWLKLQFSVSWLVDFQWASCVSIFSFLCHGRQTFSGVRVSQSLVFCVMVGRLLVGFVLLNLQFSATWLVDFQWGS